jgi:hypothetical protein
MNQRCATNFATFVILYQKHNPILYVVVSMQFYNETFNFLLYEFLPSKMFYFIGIVFKY